MKQLPRFLITLGLAAIATSILIVVLTVFPVFREEISYTVRQHTASRPLTPIDTSFGIVIPKIGANARVIANVNPFDAGEYQQALTRGVAHARGSSFPDASGNVFLFSHSSVDFYLATRYNSVFYLINKLTIGDQIDLYYRDVRYVYHVTDKKIVDPHEVSYITNASYGNIVTLMTCWPPGTSLKRLLVIAALSTE